MSPAYPPFTGPRLTLAEAVAAGGGPVAGRLEGHDTALVLVDGSFRLDLEGLSPEGAGSGDWISGRLLLSSRGGFHLDGVQVHVPRRAPSPDPHLAGRLPRLALRAEIIGTARDFFRERGFLEVDTPTRVICPGLEPHLRAFRLAGEPHRWLITSPELHLKRLLAAGAERVVEFARAFRDDERGPLHRPEFTLLEWYRSFASLEDLESDCEGLVRAAARAAGHGDGTRIGACDLTPPFGKTTVRRAVSETTGLDLARLNTRELLAPAMRDRGHPVAPDDDWDTLFFRLWTAEVEPTLGRDRPLFVHDYPASQAALARVRPDPEWPVAQRFELYVDGIELGNAFLELNDPDEQRRRHENDQKSRRDAGAEVYPLDEAFLAALASGMPPAAGIAFGLDRLVMLLAGVRSLDEVVPFPESR